jgi:dystrophin
LITNVSLDLGAYQVALEEVLTWLLEAEDQLSQHEQIPENLEMLKERFHAHEVIIARILR